MVSMMSFGMFLLWIFALQFQTISAQYNNNNNNTTRTEYCRDLYGYDCTDADELFDIFSNVNFSKSNLEDICCKIGGGQRISKRSHLIVRQIENVTSRNANEFDLQKFQVQGSAQHRALFWITVDDEFVTTRSWRPQRYAMAVLFFQLGGAKRWKTCWSGQRFSVNGTLYASSRCEHDLYPGTKAWLSSNHECEWAFVECDRNKFVTGISMVGNVMEQSNELPYIRTTMDTMSLPPEIALLDKLTKLDLRNNFLTGTIPSNIGSLQKLRLLNLYGNQLSGVIPSEIFQITGMEYFTLGRNLFNGSIMSGLNNFSHLRALYLGYNAFSGSIPTDLNLYMLENLNLVGTALTGSISSDLCASRKLFRVTPDINCTCCDFSSPITTSQNACYEEAKDDVWLSEVDETFHHSVSVHRSCDWLELYDLPNCSQLGILKDKDNKKAIHECCYCNKCSDYSDYVDAYNNTCLWYEKNEYFGCSSYGRQQNANGVTAQDACCWCGGGYSYGVEPPTISPTILDSSITTVEPTIAESCDDMENWVDKNFNTCEWYVTNDSKDCPGTGMIIGSKGITAHEACCWCGGGSKYIAPSMTPYVSNAPISESCSDIEGWIDFYFNFTCKDLERIVDYNCPFYSDWLFSSDLVFAGEACCHCGGGNMDSNNVNVDNTIGNKMKNTCKDLQIPRPWPIRDCEWFAKDTNRCELYGEETMYEVFLDDYESTKRTANNVCCVCGGGTSNCIDFPEWHDSHRTNKYTCADYDQEEECILYGAAYFNYGHTASTACCVCGGGYDPNSSSIVLLESNPRRCYSYYNWSDVEGDATCDSFLDKDGIPDVEKCLSFGHMLSPNGINATTACCECQYGYDTMGNGGYRGNLIGKVLRAGFIDNIDTPNMYNFSHGMHRCMGAICDFLFSTFGNSGIGIVSVDVDVDHGDTNLTEEVFHDSYDICLNSLLENNVDVCIGPYWDLPSLLTPRTKPLYREDMFLIVRKTSTQFINVVTGSVFSAFTPVAWIAIAFIILMYAFTVDIVTNQKISRNVIRYIFSCGRFGSMLYSAIILFIGKRPVQQTENREEKFAIFGFSIFTLFVIATFTGSITASLVNMPGNVEYISLDDAIQKRAHLCIHHQLMSELKRVNPGTSDILLDANFHDTHTMMKALNRNNQNRTCDAVISSFDAFQSVLSASPDFCDQFLILTSEPILELNVIIPISLSLRELANEIVSETNRMLDHGWFQSFAEQHNTNTVVSETCDNEVVFDGTTTTVDAQRILLPATVSIFFNLIAICLFTYHRRHGSDANNDTHNQQDNTSNESNNAKLSEQMAFETSAFTSSKKDLNETTKRRYHVLFDK